ncbi:hypothetical protein H1C71_041917 [Ictidomys tridecemlineatus]|nr:hypothetical protein H1C71_041917 [Ictidomys tridecemlineatus]
MAPSRWLQDPPSPLLDPMPISQVTPSQLQVARDLDVHLSFFLSESGILDMEDEKLQGSEEKEIGRPSPRGAALNKGCSACGVGVWPGLCSNTRFTAVSPETREV